MTNNEDNLREEFRKEFGCFEMDGEIVFPCDGGYCSMSIKEIENFWLDKFRKYQAELQDTYKNDLPYPMGVSQWRNHGKKYGYDKYFRDALVERIEHKLRYLGKVERAEKAYEIISNEIGSCERIVPPSLYEALGRITALVEVLSIIKEEEK